MENSELKQFAEQLKQAAALRRYAEATLQKRGNAFMCPACGSGTHEHGTPAFSITPDGMSWKCFACGRGGDVFDLAGIVSSCEGHENFRKQVNAVADALGVSMPEGKAVPSSSKKATYPSQTAPSLKVPQDARFAQGRERERRFIERCREAMTPDTPGWAYLEERGFTGEEIRRFGFGWNLNSSNGWETEDGHRRNGSRVVLPWLGNVYYHVDRAIFNDAKAGKYDKPKAAEVGPQPLFNPSALEADTLFVVEGVLDAYAVLALGYQAIALAGTSWRPVVAAISEANYRGVVIAMLDFDKPGWKANEELCGALTKAGAAVYVPKQSQAFEFKDAAEGFQRDREAMRNVLADAVREGKAEATRQAERRYDAALSAMRAVNPFNVVLGIFELKDIDEPVPTGFSGLDSALGGGLHRGLTVLGAISSLGKTTLCTQVADNMAASGRSVLFVTIEQSATELAAKSITRLMRQRNGISVSTRELLSGSERKSWGEKQRAALLDAANAHSTMTDKRLRIYEGTEQPSVKDIRAVAEFMRDHDGKAPVVFVDYLQLLAPQDEHDTDKRAVDGNIRALRQMARDLKTPVVVISSLNRSSYSGAISLDSFKESGMVEYSADLLLGLQPYGMSEAMDKVREADKKTKANRIVRENKASKERAEEVVILKNRNGGIPAHGIPLTFYPVPSLFKDGLHGKANEAGRRIL